MANLPTLVDPIEAAKLSECEVAESLDAMEAAAGSTAAMLMSVRQDPRIVGQG